MHSQVTMLSDFFICNSIRISQRYHLNCLSTGLQLLSTLKSRNTSMKEPSYTAIGNFMNRNKIYSLPLPPPFFFLNVEVITGNSSDKYIIVPSSYKQTVSKSHTNKLIFQCTCLAIALLSNLL